MSSSSATTCEGAFCADQATTISIWINIAIGILVVVLIIILIIALCCVYNSKYKERVKITHVRPQEDFMCHCHVKFENVSHTQGGYHAHQYDTNPVVSSETHMEKKHRHIDDSHTYREKEKEASLIKTQHQQQTKNSGGHLTDRSVDKLQQHLQYQHQHHQPKNGAITDRSTTKDHHVHQPASSGIGSDVDTVAAQSDD